MSHIGERTIRELNVTERVPLLLTPDEISDLLSPEPMSRSLRRNIVNQLVNVEGLEADE